jgi:hypothetical protein
VEIENEWHWSFIANAMADSLGRTPDELRGQIMIFIHDPFGWHPIVIFHKLLGNQGNWLAVHIPVQFKTGMNPMCM